MQCPACSTANPEGSYFCAHCGKQMRSAFGRGEGPVQLGQAPELSAPLAAVARQATQPANLSLERPAGYAPPELGGKGWQAPAAPAAYVSPLRAAGPPTTPLPAEPLPPETPVPPEGLDRRGHGAPPHRAVEPAVASADQAARADMDDAALSRRRVEGQSEGKGEDELPPLLQHLPPGSSPFRQGFWIRPGTEKREPPEAGSATADGEAPAASSSASPIWNMDLGELIGAARDRAEKLRIGMTPTALADYDQQQGNTSGLGRGQPLPQAARGFSLGGLVPGGLYAFACKNPLVGFIGLGLLFFKWYPLYVIYIGVVGRQMAWQNRRFEDVAHYNRVMQRWDIAGFYMLPLYVIWWIGTLVYKSL